MRLECPEQELNQRHKDFQSFALPTELSGHGNCQQLLYFSTSRIHTASEDAAAENETWPTKVIVTDSAPLGNKMGHQGLEPGTGRL